MLIPCSAATPSNKIQKMVIAYGVSLNSDSNRKWIASHFDILDTGFCKQGAIVKQLNPNIKILGYRDAISMQTYQGDWNYVNQYESWFAHTKTGQRLMGTIWGAYLMNPNSGWNAYFIQRAKDLFKLYPCYDGLFIDDVAMDMQELGYTFNYPYTSFASGILTNWKSSLMNEMLKTKQAFGSKIIMGNAWKYTYVCQNATHATFWENFIHGRSSAYNKLGYSVDMCIYSINSLHKQAELGNIIGVNSGCKDADLHLTAAKQWQKFTLACFLFSVVNLSKAYYSWQFVNTDSSKGYFPEMDLIFGQPVSDYKVLIKNTYIREFKYYYVVANLDMISSSHFTLNGIGYTLQPRNAMFIKK
jgi:hypothetical protein